MLRRTAPNDTLPLHHGENQPTPRGRSPAPLRGRSPAPLRGRSPAPLADRGRSPTPYNRAHSPAPRGRSPAATQSNFSLGDPRQYSYGRRSNSSRMVLVSSLLAVVMLFSSIFYKVKYDASYSQLERYRRDASRLKAETAHLSKELSTQTELAESTAKELERKSSLMSGYNDRIDDLNDARTSLANENRSLSKQIQMLESAKVQERELRKMKDEAIGKNLAVLQKRIQRQSHREIIEKFGQGPHSVKFEVELEKGKSSFFVVKTASIDLMPHSVYLFLEQVHNRLWDGCAFVVNAPHVIQMGPYKSHKRKNEDLLRDFQRLELDTVSFQEYSEAYPHRKYTLGYSGRPGGPDIYINKDDNSEFHGPGGQDWNILDEEADPCFAKVVAGFEVVDEMMERESDGGFMLNPIRVVTARIMADHLEEVEREKYEELKALYKKNDDDFDDDDDDNKRANEEMVEEEADQDAGEEENVEEEMVEEQEEVDQNVSEEENVEEEMVEEQEEVDQNVGEEENVEEEMVEEQEEVDQEDGGEENVEKRLRGESKQNLGNEENVEETEPGEVNIER